MSQPTTTTTTNKQKANSKKKKTSTYLLTLRIVVHVFHALLLSAKAVRFVYFFLLFYYLLSFSQEQAWFLSAIWNFKNTVTVFNQNYNNNNNDNNNVMFLTDAFTELNAPNKKSFGAAEENARLPQMDVFTRGTCRVERVDERNLRDGW